jgi:hypothetical protein
VRECLESLGEMLEKSNEVESGRANKEQYDFTVLSDNEFWALEALLAKASSNHAVVRFFCASELCAGVDRRIRKCICYGAD